MLPLLPTLLLVLYIFSLFFTLQAKQRPETSQWAPPPHQMDGNYINGSPYRLASPSAQNGGNGKITEVDSTVANMGIFLPFSSFFAWTDEDAARLFPTNTPWCILPAHGAAAAMPPVPMHTWDHHNEINHPVWPGFWTGAVHLGGGTRGV